ncbi:hypothetical protein ABE65_011520 [Fictibacillus phosphorivorans]|uniref:ABC transmembrane type-1 domain-containing protein n=1 Tax=Fictibacillus phosphorivorans TaxID=1221500 RepID=A0A160IN41_9BACL|nr:ABC transporter permease subunit [Fictibacillus phosphorivorans]ANC77396.1 hypothetical protein ABE65_011520 [Fictibacillus phosphorivorans]
MIKRLLKNKSFFTGAAVLMIIFFGSIFYKVVFDDHIPQPGIKIIYDNDGNIIKTPISPRLLPPLGSDSSGYSIFHILLVGAKYTIGIALIVTFLRLLVSVLAAICVSTFIPNRLKFLRNVLNSFNFFPTVFIAFFLLQWVLLHDYLEDDQFTFSLSERLTINIVVLVIIAVPSLTVLISSEIEKVLKEDFIESAKILGASKIRVLTKHVRPILAPQLAVIYFREFIAVMLLIAHLGILEIFVGGGTPKQDLFMQTTIRSVTNEWSGLIGGWWRFIWTSYPWIAIAPIACFTIVILAAKLIVEGLEKVIYLPSSVGKIEKENRKRIPKSDTENAVNFVKVQNNKIFERK